MSIYAEFPHKFFTRKRLPGRFGQPCRILVVARRMNSVLVEFSDGFKVVTSLNYIRKRRLP